MAGKRKGRHMRIPNELLDVIAQGEGMNVEFKRAKTDIPAEVYSTICAFSNRYGGHIFLGVDDSGTIVGVQQDRITHMKQSFTSAVNNPNNLYPPLYLHMIEYEVDGVHLLYVHIPSTSSVCRQGGRIFDRNNDSNIDITDNEALVYQLYARKQDSYYVNKVYPVFSVQDLRHDLINRARLMTRTRTQTHPWLHMDDEQLLRSAALVLTDTSTGKEGITLAAILLFGTDTMIMSALSHHKTDAIFRVFNLDRYDDRDVITTNLLDSYDRLMAFGQKHLNDTFVMEGVQSISARDKILREVISNSLAHRDYSSPYVAKFVIERDHFFTENSNRAQSFGALRLDAFKPVAKNPAISKVFREIGLADELGSGMRNTYKYTSLYSQAEPTFVEGDIFKTIVPLQEAATATVGPTPQAHAQPLTQLAPSRPQPKSRPDQIARPHSQHPSPR